MKPTFEIKNKLLDNENEFNAPFFRKFKPRHAPQPLQLTETVSKDYLFPTFHTNVTCAQAICFCSYKKAIKIMPHPMVKPAAMPGGRAIVAFSLYEYKTVMNIAPYNEIAMIMPVVVNPVVNIPLLPMLLKGFPGFGYYVFGMPVTSIENMIRGNKIWGLPKVVREIDIYEEDGHCVGVGKEEDGKTYLEVRVPVEGKPTGVSERVHIYSRLGDKFIQSESNFSGSFNVNVFPRALFNKKAKPAKPYIKIWDGPTGRTLLDLDIEEHPFQFRFTRSLNGAFDLPNPNYKSPIKF